MDTPERSKVGGTPISKFEDSPVFNFINSLSPIQPVKSVHSIHTFHSPGSAAISSVFSSPHVSFHKESRFFIRHPFPDSVKQDASSDGLDESNVHSGVSNGAVLSASIVLSQENCNITCSLNEASVDLADDSSTQPDFSQSVQVDNGSPNHNTSPFYGVKLDFKLDISCTPSERVKLVQNMSENTKNPHTTKIGLEVQFPADQMKEDASESDWDNLISDNTDDLLIFETATGSETSKSEEKDYGISLNSHPNASGLHNVSQDSFMDDDGETGEHDGMSPTRSSACQEHENFVDLNLKTEAELNNGVPLGCKVDSQQHRGVRRRCLVFEAAGVSKKNIHNNSNAPPSISLPINAKPNSENRQLVSSKTSKTPVPYVLPGIGLHLNALARTSKDRPISQKTKTPGREFISRPCSMRPFSPAIAGENQSFKLSDPHQSPDPNGSELHDSQAVHSDVSLIPALGIEESTSPKKKRRKTENSGENEGCRRCNCKKSKCLKLYCECFAAGVYCVEPCSCQGCLNKPVHEETVLTTRKQIESRNPLAFAPKVIRTSEHDQEMGEESNKTPASARHKRGCNCKKSNCLKKYCECYQGGVGCSFSCRCEGCKNAFGRKDGFEEIEFEEDLDACEKEGVKSDDGKANANVPKLEHNHLSESILPVTPFPSCRSSVKLPFLSSGKPPRSSTLSLMNRSENQQAECKSDQIFHDDDTSEDLRVNSSPCTAVKTASPNGKRVSLPLNGFGLSPNLKGGRKLILKSIPSFPSLTTDAPSSTQINSSVFS
ncbi:protein tesmin/TSO1-like CXC 3 [Dendrobium catenatum]|uniref:Protein tesmin/TSO1-like CXC 2 n=1 Tax=Dendrobium catenatum TaxID=906689 RepID=A0A2I0WLZ6_9ASPA|nr:protein tesmin/TSO1-like CXC 3 [Dendrobium catenatum]PKU76684.1 Protein tesmin/TSO1-like CXC 2 [Dendrobium catenatum]